MDIVKNNEPHLALYADNDGLYYYDKILKNCNKYLKEKYLIAFEIGSNQGLKIKDLANKYLNCNIEIIKDLQGLDRFVFIKIETKKSKIKIILKQVGVDESLINNLIWKHLRIAYRKIVD